MKHALVVASVASMITQFNMHNIRILREIGYAVDVACNFEEGSTCTAEEIVRLKNSLADMSVRCYQIDFSRSPTKLSGHMKALNQLRQLACAEHYDLMHCHSPIAGFLSRLAFNGERKSGTKTVYTAHGFHFYKGAPLKDWLLYYPLEKCASHWTDVLLTINAEDFELARKKLRAKRTEYIPGVGVDVNRLAGVHTDRDAKRAQLGLPEDSFVLMSTGELNDNKNHITMIKALASLHRDDVYYIIAGIGSNEALLKATARELGISERVHLLGYRTDIPQLLKAADVFCFPSRREGLGLGAIEAMACGLPLLTSNVGGINDYSQDGVTGFKYSPMDVAGFAQGILTLKNDPAMIERIGRANLKCAKRFSVENSVSVQKKIYESI